MLLPGVTLDPCSTHHEVVVVVSQRQTVCSQNLLQQIRIPTQRRVDNNRLPPQLVDAGNGRNRRKHQVRPLVQLAKDSHLLVLVEAVVERIVHRRRQDVVFAAEDGREGGGAVGDLVVDDVEPVLGEEAELVGD